MKPDTHSITASYAGNSTFAPSASSATTVTVTGPALTASTTTLTASATAVTPGANVTFNVVVAPASGTGTPTGTVSFMNGTTALAAITYDTVDFTAPSFTVAYTSMSGGANSSGAVYSYYIPTAGGYDRNSNLLTAVDSVMGQWNYTYDNLNRVVTAAAPTSQPAGVNANFAGVGAGWSYDPFGNRQSESWTGNNDTAVPGSTSATYYGNNQLSWTNVNAAGSNVTYDQAGNMTYDGKNSYLYDAEGRICALGETVNGTTILTGYIYDAGGTRVAKGSCVFGKPA